jgi:hypothetical protein
VTWHKTLRSLKPDCASVMVSMVLSSKAQTWPSASGGVEHQITIVVFPNLAVVRY